jgi:flagellar hook protein FlgE
MGGSLGSALSAAASGVAGVRRAGAIHEGAADTVQRSFHGENGQSGPRFEAGAATLNLSSVSQDLAGAFTDMIRADTLNKANVAVIKTSDEMTKDLLNIVG